MLCEGVCGVEEKKERVERHGLITEGIYGAEGEKGVRNVGLGLGNFEYGSVMH